jgi:hypothetical protein
MTGYKPNDQLAYTPLAAIWTTEKYVTGSSINYVFSLHSFKADTRRFWNDNIVNKHNNPKSGGRKEQEFTFKAICTILSKMQPSMKLQFLNIPGIRYTHKNLA